MPSHVKVGSQNLNDPEKQRWTLTGNGQVQGK